MIDDLVRTDFSLVDKRDEVRNVLGYLRGDTDAVPVITDGDRAFGVLNERGMVRSRLDPHAKVESYVIGTRLVDPRASVGEAVDVCVTSGLDVVPVERDGEVVGVVEAADLFRRLVADGGASATAVELAQEVPTLREDQTIGEAVHQLRETGALALPVVDEHDRVTGALERRAVLRVESTVTGVQGSRRGLDRGDQGETEHRMDLPVGGFLDSNYASVDRDATAEEVLDALDQFRYAVVVDSERRVVGLVTAPDALRRVSRG